MKIEVDGMEFEVEEEGKLLDVLLNLGFDIPHICYHRGVGSYGACRLCLVEVEEGGEWKIVASCTVNVAEGIRVRTNSERIVGLRKGIVELLAKYTSSELVQHMSSEFGIEVTGERRCILCGLCVNVCSLLGISAISFEGRGIDKRVSAPFGVGTEFCLGCLACTNVCPTGAIRFENGKLMVGRKVIADHRMVKCKVCGKPVTTEKHAESLGVEVICRECREKMAASNYRGSYICRNVATKYIKRNEGQEN